LVLAAAAGLVARLGLTKAARVVLAVVVLENASWC
jgi:hypothetical protein